MGNSSSSPPSPSSKNKYQDNSSLFRSSAMEVTSSSLFNYEEEEEEEEEDQQNATRPTRWLLDPSSVDQQQQENNVEISSSSSRGGEETTLHSLLKSEEIISRVLIMNCSDLLDDLLNLRLVCKTFMKIIDQFNFISFQAIGNYGSIDYIVDDEDIKQNQLTCKRMRIIKKLVENITSTNSVGNQTTKQEELPNFLLNNIKQKHLQFTYNLKERENVTKFSNPFLVISNSCTILQQKHQHSSIVGHSTTTTTTASNQPMNPMSYFQIPSIEIYLEIGHSSILPVHFNMLLISEETSSFEEYLFRYSLSISEDGLWETKIFPIHRRQFFSSPKNNQQQQPIIVHHSNCIRKINRSGGGRYRIVFSFTNNFQLEIATLDILNNNYCDVAKDVPLLSDVVVEECNQHEHQTRQKLVKGNIKNLIREVKISCSSSNLINICKRVTFKSSFDIS